MRTVTRTDRAQTSFYRDDVVEVHRAARAALQADLEALPDALAPLVARLKTPAEVRAALEAAAALLIDRHEKRLEPLLLTPAKRPR